MAISGSWVLSGTPSYSTLLFAENWTLTAQGSAPSTETVTFSAGALLALESASSFSAELLNFFTGNSVDFSEFFYGTGVTISTSGY